MSSNVQKLRMAAVGDYESILPFQAVGAEPFFLSEGEADKLRELLLKFAREGYAVVFLLDTIFQEGKDLVAEINENYAVSIIPIPGVKGSTGVGVEAIRKSVEKAVGMDIFTVR